MSCTRGVFRLACICMIAAGAFLTGCPLGSTQVVSSRAYSGHENDQDANNFVNAYPAMVGTRLDDCQLCHRAGVANTSTKKIYNPCSYCHLIPFPDPSYSTTDGGLPNGYKGTLNQFGLDYLDHGRSVAAFIAIAAIDSDNDNALNDAEIKSGRFPGSAASKPGQPLGPTFTLTLDQVKAMTQHPEFLLLNANKQQYDFYASYNGPALKDLLVSAGVDLANATGVSVFAPDGFKQDFGIADINASYPDSHFYLYSPPPGSDPLLNFIQYPASIPTNPATGSAYADGDAVTGLWLTVAWQRDGGVLSTSYYDASTGRLEGEGPFRVIPPQKTPGRPDRGSGFTQAHDGWDYDSTLDHNAGSSPRGACIIRVNPMPAGYEEYDTSNGWSLITDKKIVIYGCGVH
jgi:hypothetical protein